MVYLYFLWQVVLSNCIFVACCVVCLYFCGRLCGIFVFCCRLCGIFVFLWQAVWHILILLQAVWYICVFVAGCVVYLYNCWQDVLYNCIFVVCCVVYLYFCGRFFDTFVFFVAGCVVYLALKVLQYFIAAPTRKLHYEARHLHQALLYIASLEEKKIQLHISNIKSQNYKSNLFSVID